MGIEEGLEVECERCMMMIKWVVCEILRTDVIGGMYVVFNGVSEIMGSRIYDCQY